MITKNKDYYFEYPTQVKFIDPYDGRQLAGIAYKDEVICGCCGTIYSIKVLIKKPIEILSWVNIIDEIMGN